MFLISDAHAQTATPPAAGGGGDFLSTLTSGGGGMLFPIVVLAAFFLFFIRPQMKRQKEATAMLSALAKGDEVVTTGGLLGKITGLSDTSLGLQIADGVEVQVQRNAVAQVLPKGTLKSKE